MIPRLAYVGTPMGSRAGFLLFLRARPNYLRRVGYAWFAVSLASIVWFLTEHCMYLVGPPMPSRRFTRGYMISVGALVATSLIWCVLFAVRRAVRNQRVYEILGEEDAATAERGFQ